MTYQPFHEDVEVITYSPPYTSSYQYVFEGKISCTYKIKKRWRQDIYSRAINKIVVSYSFFPKLNTGLFLNKKYKKVLKKLGIMGEHVRDVSSLARRMCCRKAFPEAKHLTSRKWVRRYEERLRQFIGFVVPCTDLYVEVTVLVESPYSTESEEFILAYDPDGDELLTIKQNVSWKSVGVNRAVLYKLFPKIRRGCIKTWWNFRNPDLF